MSEGLSQKCLSFPKFSVRHVSVFTHGAMRGICAESAKEYSLGQSEATPQEMCDEIAGALKERKNLIAASCAPSALGISNDRLPGAPLRSAPGYYLAAPLALAYLPRFGELSAALIIHLKFGE